jgi:DNA-directed RNA polymerase alpha subunit
MINNSLNVQEFVRLYGNKERADKAFTEHLSKMSVEEINNIWVGILFESRSARVFNALERANIHTVGDILLRQKRLYQVAGLGPKSLEIVRSQLTLIGITIQE